MASLTPENIKARKVALWVCSFLGLVFFFVLTTGAAISARLLEARNPIVFILVLMLCTGVMHALRKELRIPAVALSAVSIAALLILFLGPIHS